jgi:hypothetical protein
MRVREELLGGLRRVCASFPDDRQWRPDNIAIADAGLTAFFTVFPPRAIRCVRDSFWEARGFTTLEECNRPALRCAMKRLDGGF